MRPLDSGPGPCPCTGCPGTGPRCGVSRIAGIAPGPACGWLRHSVPARPARATCAQIPATTRVAPRRRSWSGLSPVGAAPGSNRRQPRRPVRYRRASDPLARPTPAAGLRLPGSLCAQQPVLRERRVQLAAQRDVVPGDEQHHARRPPTHKRRSRPRWRAGVSPISSRVPRRESAGTGSGPRPETGADRRPGPGRWQTAGLGISPGISGKSSPGRAAPAAPVAAGGPGLG